MTLSKLLVSLACVSLPAAAFALGSNDAANLQSAVANLKAKGIVSTPEILSGLTERPLIGSKTNVFVSPKPSVQSLTASYQELLAKHGLSSTNTTAQTREALQKEGSDAEAAGDLPRLGAVIIDERAIERLQQELAPGAATTITNMVVEPVYGSPLWTGPTITGEDVEAVQRPAVRAPKP